MTPGGALLVATGNAGKLREFREILSDLPVSWQSLADGPPVQFPEEGDDYRANAIAKARTAALARSVPALADDSGLEVEGLGGGPGPRSARYGGPDLDDAGRVARLLDQLAARLGASRAARFVCVAALAWPDGRVETARGECAGVILSAPRGASGFGYDPVFQPDGEEGSMAELASAKKDLISHRARALAALRPHLGRIADGG